MSYQAPLPNTGALLPVPGSGQAWEVAVFNGDLLGIDNAIGADRGRLTAIESKIGNNAVVPAGTTAARDGFYGVPSSAAARIALANSAPRWFNTDKGYEERYFTSTADSAVGGYNTLYARATAGWKPEGKGLVPIALPTPNTTGGTAVVNGNKLILSASTLAWLDGVFSDDFEVYQYAFDMSFSTAGILGMQMRSAGADQSTANYAIQAGTFAGAAASASSATDSRFRLSGSSTAYQGEGKIFNPGLAARNTFVMAQSATTAQWNFQSQGRGAAAVDDGFKLNPTNGGTLTGWFQLWGLAGGHL